MELSGIHALIICSLVLSMNSSPNPKPIVNGRAAARNNQFPFAVAFALRLENSESFVVFCGGSLISQSSRSSWAISAAHCFIDFFVTFSLTHRTSITNLLISITQNPQERPENQTVYANIGGGDLTSPDAKWTKVLEVVSARFNIYSLQNDVALVKIDLGNQQVIQRSKGIPKDAAECMIYGYGSLSYQANTVTSNILRYGRVSLISFEQCEDILGRVSAPSKGMGQFCALGRNGVDACNGDSGSGLICRGKKGRFELVGVTSHGSGCGEGSAGVYEDVRHHGPWIESILKRRRN